jgi:hypothetical protein
MTEDAQRASNDEPPTSAAGGDGQTDAPARERRGPPPNPLYHPLFLPVLLVAFSLWFFWDGFITTDPEMLEHQVFNRVSFVVTALCCLRVVPRGIREFRHEREAAAKEQ